MSLWAYVARRVLALVPIALGVTFLTFMLIHLIPGDPALTILGNKATPAKIALLHKEWGLDKPLPVQYLKFLGRVVHGDLGTSLFYGVSAGTLVWQRLGVTLFLIGFAGVLSMVAAVPLAVLAATRRDGVADHTVRAVSLVGLGFPPFWIGIVLLLLFALHNGRAFPVGGYGTGLGGHIRSLFLPALTVALLFIPILIRSLRNALLEVLQSDYITTARSKGLSERRVLWRHALRNAIVSTTAVLAVNLAYLVGGTVIVEQVFDLPGLGQLMIGSIFQRDFTVVQAVALAFAILVVIIYLLADVLQAMLDPRVRFD
jgi:peptide/nickel transport system permease protein